MTGDIIPLRPERLPPGAITRNGMLIYHEGCGTHFGERLAITGAVSNPRARTIDPRRYERRAPKVVAAGTVFALSLIAWGVIIAGLWALKLIAVLLWHWGEAALTVLGVGVALAVIVIGLGLPG